ncbi:MAG: efflux RND transporter permease subunit, partial [Myxococcales bacterium]|nr:efflux RND transporter permease subunit [Myxococcales bacterium]
LNGRSAINLEIFAAAGASTVEVTQRVRAEVERLDHDPALDGIELLVFHDQGEIILHTLEDLRDTGLWGGLLAFFVLLMFLHRISTTFAAAISIPLSITTACAVLFVQGSDLDCIVMLGMVLAVGMLIDNAVVIVEAIASHSRRGEPPLRAARLGAREVGFATIASTLSTVIVFIPLQLGEPTDRAGAVLRPLGSTFTIGLLASLVVSQTAVPLLMGRILRPRPKTLRHPVFDRVAGAYAWIIRHSLRFPRLSVLVGLGLAASVYVPGAPLLDGMKLGDAERQDDNLPIRLEIAGGRGYEKIGVHVEALEQALLAQRQALGVESVSCSWGDFWGNCRAYPAEPFESEQDAERFKTRVGQALPPQPGVKYRLGERQNHWQENTDRRVVEFALRGEDMAELMRLSLEVADHLQRHLTRGDPEQRAEGTFDFITTPYEDGATELHVELDRARLLRLGLTADAVARRISLAFQGLPLGSVRGPRGEIQLRLSAKAGDSQDAGLAELRDLRIPVGEQQEVPLGAIARIELAQRPFWIQRVDRQTEVKVQVHFFHPDPMGNWDLVAAAMEGYEFPPGYGWGRSTQWRRQQEAGNEMLINLGLCLLLVYAVMASLFESFLQPLGILVTCLLGCFGAPWALWLTDTTLDTTAIVGMFILIGIVVNNGIMLVDRTTQLRAEGVPRDEALQRAGRDRIRPIAMTMVTTILGLVPMLIHHPTLAEDGETVVDTVLRWPRYHPLDQNLPSALVLWKIQPTGEQAHRYLGLVPPRTDEGSPCTVDADCCEPQGDCDPTPNYCDPEAGECTAVGQPDWTYHYVYQPSCSRAVRGSVVLLGDDLGHSPLVDASVSLRYADGETERIGAPVFGETPPEDRPPECTDDDDCDASSEYCDPATRQCFVALAGRPADRDSASVSPGGQFDGRIYTYCDRFPSTELTRSFHVTVDPPGPLPTVNYVISELFSPDSSGMPDAVDLGAFCVPDWGVDPGVPLAEQGVPMELRFEGPTARLVPGTDYECCDVGCLPATAEDADAGPPTVTKPCDGTTSVGAPRVVQVQAPFVVEDPQAWEDADCAPLDPDADGRVGSLTLTAQCGDPGEACRVQNIALGTTEEPRIYQVRFESQVGSVVASGDFEVQVTEQVPSDPLTLAPRVLVTGVVDVDETTCARRNPKEDCAAREAIVLAERLRMPDEPEGSVPGPYFHNVPTFYDPVAQRDGAFVLPLDPGGVYVVTALPLAGAEGGPADFTVVDLRDDAPTELQPLRLVLEDGVVVTLRLDQFDQRTVMIPMDRGSYLAEGQQLLHPLRANTADPFIDLNRVGECWTATKDGPQGCQIRRLIPPGSSLARSQVGIVRFTARRSDRAECSVSCAGAAASE